MFLQSDDEQLGLVLGLVFAVVAGVMALVLGLALHRPAAPALAPLAVPALPVPVLPVLARVAVTAAVPAPPSAQATSDAASITVEYGVVKFYFASGRADLAEGAAGALVDVVKAARSGKKVLIAGFHDTKGNAVANAELARRRALVVQDALRAAGVPERQISLHKPEPAGPGPDAEARRVEITLQ
jgi:K(+)-stimulated pyrophosphate-energized sodium pump